MEKRKLMYQKPMVEDRGRLEQITRDTETTGRPEGAITTIVWSDAGVKDQESMQTF